LRETLYKGIHPADLIVRSAPLSGRPSRPGYRTYTNSAITGDRTEAGIMPLEACCREEVVSVFPEATATDVARTMEEKNVGIVTDRDLVIRIIAQGGDPDSTKAVDIMTPDPITFREDMGIYEAIGKMTRRDIRRMPVVDDIIRLIGDEMAKISGNLEKQSPPLPR
jgi:hypothetical protein